MRGLLKLIFSRHAVSFFVIGAELFLIAFGAARASSLSALSLLLSLAFDILVFLYVINSECNPEYRVSWGAVVLLLPIFGAVLYFLFGKRRPHGEVLFRERYIMERLTTVGERKARLAGLSMMSENMLGIARSTAIYAGISHLCESEAKYYPSGDDMWRDMLLSMSRARRYIFLEYFILEDGEMWQGMLNTLKEKTRAGVDVRLLYDDLGSMRRVREGYDRYLRSLGIAVERHSRILPFIDPHYNNRDHRKICVIDGEVAFTGGVNIADEYINKKRLFGRWWDGGVSIRGDGARAFSAMFLSLWRLRDRGGFITDMEKYALPKCKENFTDGGVHLAVGTGPSSRAEAAGRHLVLELISTAKRALYITTPYLITDRAISDALVFAAARGVDVRIITPGLADKRWIKVMTKASYQRLLFGGVRIYEYESGFVHQKTLIADGKYVLIGTVNLDYRSLAHHYEDALLSYASPITADVERDVKELIAKSREVSPTAARLRPHEKLLKSVLTVIAPLL